MIEYVVLIIKSLNIFIAISLAYTIYSIYRKYKEKHKTAFEKQLDSIEFKNLIKDESKKYDVSSNSLMIYSKILSEHHTEVVENILNIKENIPKKKSYTNELTNQINTINCMQLNSKKEIKKNYEFI